MDKHTAGSLVVRGLTGAVALAGATQAYGAVVAGNAPLTSTITGTATAGTGGYTAWDIDGDGFLDFTIGAAVLRAGGSPPLQRPDAITSINGVYPSEMAVGYIRYSPVFGKNIYCSNLAVGTAVGSASAFPGLNNVYGFLGNRYGSTTNGQFPNTTGYVGFRFLESGQLHYGYAEFSSVLTGSTNADATCTVNYLGSYYETAANTPIIVGAVPEPGSLAALAFGVAGAAGIAASRRRKPAAQEEIGR